MKAEKQSIVRHADLEEFSPEERELFHRFIQQDHLSPSERTKAGKVFAKLERNMIRNGVGPALIPEMPPAPRKSAAKRPVVLATPEKRAPRPVRKTVTIRHSIFPGLEPTMPFPSLTVIANRLSEAEILRLLALKRGGPKLSKLLARKEVLNGKLAEVERELTELSGGAPAPKARRGSKPGRKPGRPAAVKVKAPKTAKQKPKAGIADDAKRAAMLERMAKARAARMAKAAERKAEAGA